MFIVARSQEVVKSQENPKKVSRNCQPAMRAGAFTRNSLRDSDEADVPARGSAPPDGSPPWLLPEGGISRITSPCARQGKREFCHILLGQHPPGGKLKSRFSAQAARDKLIDSE
jgi:hypothetical protein